jgi:hypothetical protein
MHPSLILDGDTQYYVGLIEAALVIYHTNKRRVKCLDCQAQLEPGYGIYHKAYRYNGYVCLNCARSYILVSAIRVGQTAGYVINALGNLQVLDCGIGRYTPEQVAEALVLQPEHLPVEAPIHCPQEGLC